MTNDVSALGGYLTKYYPQLISQTLNGLDIVKDLTQEGLVIRTLREEVALPKLVVGAGVRKLNTNVETEKHNRVWTQRKIAPAYGMKIFNVVPEDVRVSFMSAMLAPGAKREPFAQFAWKTEFEKLAQELNDQAFNNEYVDDATAFVALNTGSAHTAGQIRFWNNIVYKCVTNASAGETPTSHPAKWEDVDSKVMFNGLHTIIKEEITATNIAPIVTGSFNHTDAVSTFREVWGTVPEAKKNGMAGWTMWVSHGALEDYTEDYNNRFGTGKGIGNADLEETGMFYLKGSNRRCKIRPATWMGDSRRIILTPKNNLVIGFDEIGNANKVTKVIETLHGYKSVTKFCLNHQIADLEVLYVNDQN